MKHIRKYKAGMNDDTLGDHKAASKEDCSEEEEALYDDDPSDLDSDDMGEAEKKDLRKRKSFKFHPGIQSNMGTLKNAFYQLGFMISLLLFLSSIFTFITRR